MAEQVLVLDGVGKGVFDGCGGGVVGVVGARGEGKTTLLARR
jgi:ABC-type phosphonate transport system ATPase subunit